MSQTTDNRTRQARPSQGAVELISPPLRLSILITLLITVGGVAWACLASIPVYVNGVSYLLRLGNIDALPALTEGTVHYQFSSDVLIRNTLFARLFRLIHEPEAIDVGEITDLARKVLTTPATGPKLGVNTPYTGLVPKGQLLAWIDSPLDRNNLEAKLLSYDQANRDLVNQQLEIRRLNSKINAKISILRKQLAAESDFLKGIQGLLADGLASKSNELAQRTRVDAIQAEILTQQQELAANGQKALDAQTAQQQALVNLRSELNSYVERGFLFAENPLYIVDLVIPQAGQASLQDNILHVAREKPTRLPNRIPGYLSQSDAEQVAHGMAVLVTPVGMDRAQFGGIVGKVADVSPLPSNVDQIAERTGSQAVAQEVTSLIPDPVRVDLVLERDPTDREPNHGGFRWSSPGTPPFGLSPGNQLNLQITAQRVRPISLLIPSLLRLTGASPPTISPRRLRSGNHSSAGGAS